MKRSAEYFHRVLSLLDKYDAFIDGMLGYDPESQLLEYTVNDTFAYGSSFTMPIEDNEESFNLLEHCLRKAEKHSYPWEGLKVYIALQHDLEAIEPAYTKFMEEMGVKMWSGNPKRRSKQ